ncbi:MAG: murein DD-endopeptidase MepM/ murein hydrolase activator NlpD [Candidatus Azotimanducaceae bacterium]|jgi:murein DD-endopeptidase MepM/ murein hydrolase activator NlpD
MNNFPKTHIKIIIALTFSLVVAIVALPARNENQTANMPISLSINTGPIDTESINSRSTGATQSDLGLMKAASPTTESQNSPHRIAIQEVKSHWRELIVQSGNSLSGIFTKLGLSATDLHNIMKLGPDVAVLGKLLPGQSLRFLSNQNDVLLGLQYQESVLRKLNITRTGKTGQFTAAWDEQEPEILISYKTVNISKKNPSLFHAGKAAGLSDNLIMQLSDVFQWDISFALDIRNGDTFTILYEDIYVEGEKFKAGTILAAEFNNFGKQHTAVLYQNEKGKKSYFTPEGRSMQKAFLRDPVHFSRVSSRFNMKRLHPIHKRVMPHRGIDYAANRGTPVVASGDGKVIVARRNNASGRYVVLKHGEKYTTKYLHLSAFANGIRAGKSVKQGQIIGYVGATGWATAPHLHYEFLVKGIHRNPKTIKLPKAEPINKADLGRFKNLTQPVIARLQSISGATSYASIKSKRISSKGD